LIGWPLGFAVVRLFKDKNLEPMQHLIVPIQDIADPLLDPYRNLKNTIPRSQDPGFIAEGKLVVERLLASPLSIFSVLISEKKLAGFSRYLRPEVPILVVPHPLASELVGFDFHAGIMAYGQKPVFRLVHPFLETIDQHAMGRGRILVACPETTLPDNLGSIIRLSVAFGADGLLVSQRSADPYSRRCVRVSMGNVFQIATLESQELLSDLATLRGAGYKLIACHQSAESKDVRHGCWGEKNLLIFGNEAQGISAPVLELCDHHLEIPIAANVDSLNVSTAAAIFLYEFSRVCAIEK